MSIDEGVIKFDFCGGRRRAEVLVMAGTLMDTMDIMDWMDIIDEKFEPIGPKKSMPEPLCGSRSGEG